MAFLLLLVPSFALLVSSCSLALLLRQNSHPARFVLATVAGWLVLAYATLLSCGLLHLLRSDAVTVTSLLIAVILTWWTRDLWSDMLTTQLRSPLQPESPKSQDSVLFTNRIVCFTAITTALFGLHWLREAITGPTKLTIWDDLSYHLYYPTLWSSNQSISHDSPDHFLAWQAFFPFGSELIANWFALPFQGSARGNSLAWTSLTGWIYTLVILSSMADIVRRVATSAWAWLLPSALYLTSKTILSTSESYSDTDLALPACLLAALGFALPQKDDERIGTVWKDGAYAACLLGLSASIKMSAVFSIPLIVFVWLIRIQFSLAGSGETSLPWSRRFRVLLSGCGMFLAIGLLLAGYWYGRNFWVTGNPLFPASFMDSVGVNFDRTTLREFFSVYGSEVGWRELFLVYFKWPYFHGVIAVAGLCFQALYLGYYRRQLTRTAWITVGSLLLLVGILVMVLPNMPFSAGAPETFAIGRLHSKSFRYVALIPLLGWMSWGWLLDLGARSSWRNETALLLTVLCIITGNLVPGPFSSALFCVVGLWFVSLLLGVVSASAVGVNAQRLWNRASGRIVFVGICVFLVAAMSYILLYHGRKATACENYLRENETIGALVKQLEKQPPGKSIAIYGLIFNYLLFGEHQQFEPVKLNAQGKRAKFWEEVIPQTKPTSVDDWRKGITKSGVDLIVVLKYEVTHSDPLHWPQQYEWLKQMPSAQIVYEDKSTTIWKIMPEKLNSKQMNENSSE